MKVSLIVYVIYESVFLKMAHSSLEVQVFDNMNQCQVVKEQVVEIVKRNTGSIDKLVAKCEYIKD